MYNKKVVLFNEVTAIGSAVLEIPEEASALKFGILTTGTFSITVKGAVGDGMPYNLAPVFREPDYVNASTLTSAGYNYNIDVKGYDSIKVEITAITGSLSIVGKLV